MMMVVAEATAPMIVVLLAMVSTPVVLPLLAPSGPLVTVVGEAPVLAVVGALATPRTRLPPLRARPVVQLLPPLVSTSEPLPILLMALVLPAFWVMAALMTRPSG